MDNFNFKEGIVIENVKVLSFTHYLQGPTAAQLLADLGADVIKIESPKGAFERSWSGCDTYKNGVSVFYLLANRNQRAFSVDLKSDEGKLAIFRLLETYDVVVENFRPGVMDNLGLGYEQMRQANPRIIYCSCSGYGTSGPNVKKPGQDLLIQSFSGLATLTGNGNNPPSPIGTAAVDIHGGTLAALGILAAIIDRENTGNGHKVDASLLGAALNLQMEPVAYHLNGGLLTDRPTTGLSSRLHQSPYGIYETADGYITLSLVPIEQLSAVCTRGVFDGYSRRDQMHKRIEFDAIVSSELKKKKTQEWIEIFEEHSIWYAPVNEYDQVLKDPQVVHNRSIMTFDHPEAGQVQVLGHPNQYDGASVEMRRLPPKLGEHSHEVLESCGYSSDEISKLCASGIVYQNKEE
jgi:crotonobetainyl-CoA:carnitine CoA-transferase CaiB-like acyl-CoA transferase